MPILETPYARLDLVRQPEQPNEPLQAFDAADEYLLAQLHEQGLPTGSRVLVLNDSFGALACALAQHVQVTSSGDSHLARLALEKNLQRIQKGAEALLENPAMLGRHRGASLRPCHVRKVLLYDPATLGRCFCTT